VERREIDILIGTQMIAKGLDFPNVTLVGVVDADTGLNLPDFRAAERSFQLLAQVGGRAGRGPRGGKVLVQTRCPDHHALVHAAQHDTEGFLEAELALRQDPPAPPVLALVNLVVSGLNEIEVGATAARVADWCQRVVDRHGLAIAVLGPAPCPVARIKERWRWHAVLRGPSRDIGRLVRTAARTFSRRRREPVIVIDRDPVSML
jgi:primosomal protein N' (replication factor Y)